MKITRLHVDDFGCLHNVDFSLSGEVNQLFNENGWGKTTLAVFVKAMFYGMPPARENIKMDRKKYNPWQGGNFGGWIEFSSSKGDYRLTRKFAKTPEGDEAQLIDLKTNKQCVMPKEKIGEWIFGVGRETYEMTAFFPQQNFLSSANEQISAGVLGLDKFKYDLASVGTATTNIKKQISALKKLLVKPVDIDRVLRQKEAVQSDLHEAQLALKEIESQIFEENKKAELLQHNFDDIKKNRQTEENLLAAKQKIENQLKNESEKLSSLLLSLNNIQEKTSYPKKTFPWGIIASTGLLIVFLGLALASVVSWVVAGAGVGICFILVVMSFYYFTRKNKNHAGDIQAKDTNELKKDILTSQHTIEMLKETLAGYEGINLIDNSTYIHGQEMLYSSKIALERMIANKQMLREQTARLNNEIEGLEDRVQNSLQNNITVEEKINILQHTYDFLIKAKENVSERFVTPINNGLKSLLEKFDMRNRDYVVDANLDIKQVTDGGLKELDYSSQGYKDILSICLRFLLVQQVFKNEKPCIIMDDCFVNLDDNNIEKARSFVNYLSREMQILYICCSKHKTI